MIPKPSPGVRAGIVAGLTAGLAFAVMTLSAGGGGEVSVRSASDAAAPPPAEVVEETTTTTAAETTTTSAAPTIEERVVVIEDRVTHLEEVVTTTTTAPRAAPVLPTITCHPTTRDVSAYCSTQNPNAYIDVPPYHVVLAITGPAGEREVRVDNPSLAVSLPVIFRIRLADGEVIDRVITVDWTEEGS